MDVIHTSVLIINGRDKSITVTPRHRRRERPETSPIVLLPGHSIRTESDIRIGIGIDGQDAYIFHTNDPSLLYPGEIEGFDKLPYIESDPDNIIYGCSIFHDGPRFASIPDGVIVYKIVDPGQGNGDTFM